DNHPLQHAAVAFPTFSPLARYNQRLAASFHRVLLRTTSARLDLVRRDPPAHSLLDGNWAQPAKGRSVRDRQGPTPESPPGGGPHPPKSRWRRDARVGP